MDKQILFGRGVPHDTMIDIASTYIKFHYIKAVGTHGIDLFRYGTPKKADFKGFIPLREKLAKEYEIPLVDSDQIVASNGGMETIFFTLIALASARRKMGIEPVLVVESLTYNRIIDICALLGIKVVGVQLTKDGIDLEHLEAVVQTFNPLGVYQIAFEGNPTALNATPENITSVGEICIDGDAVHLLDLAYIDMNYGIKADNPMPVLQKNTAIYSSFTKTIAPGTKCGWGYLPEWLVPMYFDACANGRLNPNYPTQAMIASMLQDGDYNNLVEEAAQFYATRCVAMEQVVRTLFPGTFEVPFLVPPTGGGFVTVRVNISPDKEEEFRNCCNEKGVVLEKPNFFAPGFEELTQEKYPGVYYRLTFLSLDPDKIEAGVALMKNAADVV